MDYVFGFQSCYLFGNTLYLPSRLCYLFILRMRRLRIILDNNTRCRDIMNFLDQESNLSEIHILFLVTVFRLYTRELVFAQSSPFVFHRTKSIAYPVRTVLNQFKIQSFHSTYPLQHILPGYQVRLSHKRWLLLLLVPTLWWWVIRDRSPFLIHTPPPGLTLDYCMGQTSWRILWQNRCPNFTPYSVMSVFGGISEEYFQTGENCKIFRNVLVILLEWW